MKSGNVAFEGNRSRIPYLRRTDISLLVIRPADAVLDVHFVHFEHKRDYIHGVDIAAYLRQHIVHHFVKLSEAHFFDFFEYCCENGSHSLCPAVITALRMSDTGVGYSLNPVKVLFACLGYIFKIAFEISCGFGQICIHLAYLIVFDIYVNSAHAVYHLSHRLEIKSRKFCDIKVKVSVEGIDCTLRSAVCKCMGHLVKTYALNVKE